MNADLTFNSVAFKESYKDKDGSLRRSTARGINTPDDMTVKSQAYVDSVTKVAGYRYKIGFDRHDLDANNMKIITSMYVVIGVPSTVAQAQLDSIVATFKAAIADASLITNVLNNEK